MAKNTFSDTDRGWNKLVTTFESSSGETNGFVGFLRSSGNYVPKNRRGKADKDKAITIAQIAAIMEFGSADGTIPERSFIRTAISKNAKSIEKLLDKVNKEILYGRMTTVQALGIVCEYVAGLIKNHILEGVPPPNKATTIKRKQSSLPLVDTSQMINSIEWEVKSGKSGGGKRKGGHK